VYTASHGELMFYETMNPSSFSTMILKLMVDIEDCKGFDVKVGRTTDLHDLNVKCRMWWYVDVRCVKSRQFVYVMVMVSSIEKKGAGIIQIWKRCANVNTIIDAIRSWVLVLLGTERYVFSEISLAAVYVVRIRGHEDHHDDDDARPKGDINAKRQRTSKFGTYVTPCQGRNARSNMIRIITTH
nr:hypothetical protein [Tanacetum cinerariifolium]